jgi:hypothetical protein
MRIIRSNCVWEQRPFNAVSVRWPVDSKAYNPHYAIRANGGDPAVAVAILGTMDEKAALQAQVRDNIRLPTWLS